MSVMTSDYDDRAAIFDVKEGVFVEAYSRDEAFPKAILSYGSLRKLTMDVNSLEFDHEFFRVIQASASLQKLDVCLHGCSFLYKVKQIVKVWRGVASSWRLTLIDGLEGNKSRIIAQLAIRGSGKQHSADSALKDHCTVDPVDVDFLPSACDHVEFQLSDYSASLINMATQQHPSILASLKLDISQLSRVGLAALQNILRRSSLECPTLYARLSTPACPIFIAQVLASIRWFTLEPF
ncbi:hypothetical protein BG006_008677, partial [Podila minutissima]